MTSYMAYNHKLNLKASYIDALITSFALNY